MLKATKGRILLICKSTYFTSCWGKIIKFTIYDNKTTGAWELMLLEFREPHRLFISKCIISKSFKMMCDCCMQQFYDRPLAALCELLFDNFESG